MVGLDKIEKAAVSATACKVLRFRDNYMDQTACVFDIVDRTIRCSPARTEDMGYIVHEIPHRLEAALVSAHRRLRLPGICLKDPTRTSQCVHNHADSSSSE